MASGWGGKPATRKQHIREAKLEQHELIREAWRARVMLHKILDSREGWVRESGRPPAANMERQLSSWVHRLVEQE